MQISSANSIKTLHDGECKSIKFILEMLPGIWLLCFSSAGGAWEDLIQFSRTLNSNQENFISFYLQLREKSEILEACEFNGNLCFLLFATLKCIRGYKSTPTTERHRFAAIISYKQTLDGDLCSLKCILEAFQSTGKSHFRPSILIAFCAVWICRWMTLGSQIVSLKSTT